MKAFSILMGAAIALTALVGSASADMRSVYTISNIHVDKTAASTREAEANAFAEAKIVGLRRLVSKLTLPEDRANLPEGFYSVQNANSLAQAVDVDNEKRSSTVYRADLSVVYMPTRVRAALDQAGVSYVDQQAPRSLIAPVAADGMAASWAKAWPASDDNALNPFVTGKGYYSATDIWTDLSSDVRNAGAGNAVTANLSQAAGGYRVQLTRHTVDGAVVVGITDAVPSLGDAVTAASAYLDAAWKRQSVVRGSATSRAEATVRYNDLASWNRIRQSLVASALVKEFQVDAISADGAVVSFAYAGDNDRLQAELRQRGIRLENTGDSWVMTSAFGRSN